MAKAYMDRINRLRDNYFNQRVEMDVMDALYMTEGFQATEGQPWAIQKATGYKNVCEKKPIYIQDDELLVGGVAFKPRAGILNPDSACSVIENELDTISTRPYDPFYLSEESKKIFMDKIAPYWRGKCVLDRWNAMMPEKVRTMRDGGMLYVDKKFVRGYGENTPGWRTLLAKGVGGIKKEAEEKLAALDIAQGEDVLEQQIFYRSEILAAEGIIAYANRHADLAEDMAVKESDPKRKAELEKIAAINRYVPENPPRTFYEALQCMLTYEYCIFMEQNASSYNLGRMDQYLIDYYRKDIEDGILTPDDAQELLDCFWIKIAEMGLFQDGESAQFSAGYNMTVQVCAGGIDKYGDDAVNELSYMTIQATEDAATKEPNMTVRYNMAKNPDSFLRKAAECIRMGRTMPAVYDDECGIQMLQNKGIPLSEAWDWTPCGCVETNLEGRLKSYTDIGEISMGGVVDMVMNNGKSRKTGKQVSIQTGDPRTFKTFDEFYEAVQKQIAYFVDVMATMNSYLDYLSERYRPVPALSLTYPHCMEVGKDYANGGAKYNVGNGVNIIGQADIINSVADVKYLVYDEKKVTMDELCKALDANFVGYGDIHQMCIDAPKYGNDDPKADFCVGHIYNYLVDEIEAHNSKFGHLTAGMLPVSGNVPIGKSVGALPSGRYAWAPLADGIGATGGTDIKGATALLKSVSHLPHSRFTQGTQMNLKIDPKMLEGEKGLNNMCYLLKTQCSLDIYHTQYNIINKDVLIDAQEHPKQHKDLLVRVAGYTAFFVELGKDIQDDIIQRTEIENW
ncbi:glycyl radical protein [Pseudoramibacter sp.]|jgi:formate C-acetyltransferase|uniref:glycyl radical protein n=1 Tax=Pseudoramibacter sp. TaxID=2034862 RepID=UPI0025D28A7F|nr:pyruvate formate lyase family protein [Pseudoramibacter sp.]MCH4072116.1 formate C-acetyltransferase/glycerol dehydratase family glycyl radical enzyme [Pseudoramibacter sp.]MCH4105886.1 formate C-acetyltransferase/glycerol dehydratase family glycyl radical enzyme [Pseudoramibacter sp.]